MQPLTGKGADSAGATGTTPARYLGTLTLVSGSTFESARVTHVDPDGLRIRHAKGIARVPIEELSGSLRKRFGLTVEAAEAHRAELARQEEAAREKMREEVARRTAEESRAALENETTTLRTGWYDAISAGDFDYVALESAMRDRADILREAGRDDLAALVDEDRDVLKRAQIARAADPYRAEREALIARVRELEDALAAAQIAPPPPQVEVVDRLVEVPVFVPVDVPAREPGVVPPAARPPAVPRPAVPHAATPRPAVPHAGVPRPATPHPPRSGPAAKPTPPAPRPPGPAVPAIPHTIHGGHLYEKR